MRSMPPSTSPIRRHALYVSGLDYVYLAGIAITLGTALFVIGRRQRGRQVFNVRRDEHAVGVIVTQHPYR